MGGRERCGLETSLCQPTNKVDPYMYQDSTPWNQVVTKKKPARLRPARISPTPRYVAKGEFELLHNLVEAINDLCIHP